MSGRTAIRLAWSLWTLSAACVVVSWAFRSLNSSTPTMNERNPLIFDAGFFLLFLSFATVGALVASRRPGNPIGWIFCFIGLSTPLATVSEEYALYALVTRPGSLPGGGVMAWLATLVGGPIMFSMLAFVFLLFPNGQLLSSRWRLVVWINLLAIALGFAWNFKPGRIGNFGLLNVDNPFGVAGAGALLEQAGNLGVLLALVAVIAGAISLVLRLRRARGEERQQLKWFVFAGTLFCAVFATGPLLWSLPPSPGTNWIWPTLFLLGVGSIAAAAGIAILRYRLYDIDVIINRTLVYGTLTVSLALVYFVGVATAQTVFRLLTGQEQQSQLAVVASTLAIAALFSPLRHRLQEFVDRRFYRRKYNAVKTLAGFSARLRDEVDLRSLEGDLVGVVRETVQPAHVSLWLREREEKR